MSIVKWIHFSDLHFNKTSINTRLLRDNLTKFLQEENISCDYAFFSGDLRNAPDKCFQDESVIYLRELCESVGVPTERFFMVPGNHDVNRDLESRKNAVQRIWNNNETKEGYYKIEEGKIQKKDLDIIKRGLKDYLNIIEDFYEDFPERIELYKTKTHFLVQTEDFNIIHLDSTISYNKGQENDLIIGTDMLYDLLKEIDQSKFTIILSHYPYDSFKAEERTSICRILEDFGVQMWLSGHLHDVLVQMHRKAFHEFQCGNLLTDGGTPNILIGTLDTKSGRGSVRAYIWQKDAAWVLNRYLDRMSSNDKSVYEFELTPTEVMRKTGQFYKNNVRECINKEWLQRAIDQVVTTYEDRYGIVKNCKYGDLEYPIIAKAFTPAQIDTLYLFEIFDISTYSLSNMEDWLQKLVIYRKNYIELLNKDALAILRLVIQTEYDEERRQICENDFQNLYQSKYSDQYLYLEFVEQVDQLNEKLKNGRVFIDSVTIVHVEKEAEYNHENEITGKVFSLQPVLVEKYKSLETINKKIDEYYKCVWNEWNKLIDKRKELFQSNVENQTNKNITERTLTDGLVYEIKYNKNGILCVVRERYLYEGGAHGIPLRKSFVFDLNSGSEMKLHEILHISFDELTTKIKERLEFLYSADGEEFVNECLKQIENRYHEVDEFQFYINNNAIYIFFGVYEIAGYAMGFMDLYIWEDIQFLSRIYDSEKRVIVRKKGYSEIFQEKARNKRL